MKKILKSQIVHTLLFIFIISLFAIPYTSSAQPATESGYHIITSVPGTNIKQGDAVKDNYTLATYIKNIYMFALAIVGLVAFSAMIYWSLLYIAAAGNPSKMADSISGIKDAVLGLALLLLASLILGFINPKLAVLNPLDTIPEIPDKNSAPGNVASWLPIKSAGFDYGSCIQYPPAGSHADSTECTDPNPSSAQIIYQCCKSLLGSEG